MTQRVLNVYQEQTNPGFVGPETYTVYEKNAKLWIQNEVQK